jgi:hypothetical protein
MLLAGPAYGAAVASVDTAAIKTKMKQILAAVRGKMFFMGFLLLDTFGK